MAKYGQTWWGQQWLNSLSSIDYDNRLPRGRSYATNGSVKSVTFEKNKILAKVQGSRKAPYNVSIIIPTISDKNKDDFKDTILKRPELLSRLLNHEMPEELFDVSQQMGIPIFPKTWKDFNMDCSCPDWAVPCKHLAAVLYIMANEIDKNPFLLLQLRGVNLKQKLHLDAKEAGSNKAIAVFNALVVDEESDKKIIQESLPAIDYSTIKSEAKLLNLLSANSLFYPKDFKPLLENAYKGVVKEVLALEYQSDRTKALSKRGVASITLDTTTWLHQFSIVDSGEVKIHEIDTLLNCLASIEDEHLNLLHQSFLFIYNVFLFTLRLASENLFVPKLYALEGNRYAIRWLMSKNNLRAIEIFNILLKAMPSETLLVKSKNRKKTKTLITREERLNQLIHAFIQSLLVSAYNNKRLNAAWYEKTSLQQIIDLFALGKPVEFTKFELSQIPLTINQWLTVFNISEHRFTPVIKVDEDKHGFSISLLVGNSLAPLEEPMPFSEVFSSRVLHQHQIQILKDLSLTAQYFPRLNEIIAAKGTQNLMVSVSEFSDILTQVLPIIKMLGVSILLPKELKELIKPHLQLIINKKEGVNVSIKSLVGLSKILEYNWMIAIGNKLISTEEFNRHVAGLSGLVKLHNSYIFLDEQSIQALNKSLSGKSKLTTSELLQAIVAEETAGVKAGLDSKVTKLVNQLMSSPAPLLPCEIEAQLRPYQIRGFEWLVRNAKLGLGSIIADDMGLGKTLQVIALIQHLKNEGSLASSPALVVAPTTLLTNWQKEVEKFAPKLAIGVYYGIERNSNFSDFDIVLTSYGMIRNNLSTFEQQKWHALIVDEAQNIKNNGAEQTKAVKKIKAEIHIAMSGTPVENRLTEYWSIFDFTNKGYLSSLRSFTEEFVKPIHFNNDQSKISLFKRITAPFILRRLKSDKSIISDLPDKLETNYFSQLTAVQAAIYQTTVNQAIEQINELEGISRKGMVLKMLTALKQIGNHPMQYLKNGESRLSDSAKLQLALQLVNSILDSDEKVLIFTQYKEMGDILVKHIEQTMEEQLLFLHGGVSREKRNAMVELFQTSPNHRIFILSLKAGGTGLNLTAASHVIHYDLWWNPAVEAQATDRAYRIGQKQNVMVYRLINSGTIEEKIDVMINTKRKLANLTVATGETWLGNLSDNELMELVRLDK